MSLKNPFVESIELRPYEQKLYYRLECDSSVYTVSDVRSLKDARNAISMLRAEEQLQIDQNTAITVSYASEGVLRESRSMTVYSLDLNKLMELSRGSEGSSLSTSASDRTLRKLRRGDLVSLVEEQTELLNQRESEARLREQELRRQVRVLQEQLEKAAAAG